MGLIFSSSPSPLHLSLFLVQPGFYVVNWLLLGKTLLALREREKAKQWLTKAAQLESVLIEDLEVCDINAAVLNLYIDMFLL